MFTELFRKRYLESLHTYRTFYDDLNEYGNSQTPDEVIYFVHGLNGTAGQIRFALPPILEKFGHNIYIKSCYHPAFASRVPIWEKYNPSNIEARIDQIRKDITDLLKRFAKVKLVASSTGFYDLNAALQSMKIPDRTKRLELIWIATAPDQITPSRWEALFYRLNGFTHNGHKWWAFPNHNLLKVLHTETNTHSDWRDKGFHRRYFKIDLESRFTVANVYWDYVSPSCFEALLTQVRAYHHLPLDIPAYVLVAEHDGFWEGMSKSEIMALIDRYFGQKQVFFRPSTHLWVNQPHYVAQLMADMPLSQLNGVAHGRGSTLRLA